VEQKIKSPLELVVSALRSLQAEVMDAQPSAAWIGRLGQWLYACQVPTGYPDRAEAWVSSGSLLGRMNFGLALARGSVRGVEIDLETPDDDLEPESLQAALEQWAIRMMPERDLAMTLSQLAPMLGEPEILRRVEQAAARAESEEMMVARGARLDPIVHVVGLIVGSPQFQRR